MTAQIESIPNCLKELPNWVRWRQAFRKGSTKPTKIPQSAIDGSFAATDDPRTWSTFDRAIDNWGILPHMGIGFVFTDSDPFVGIDIDDCRHPGTGVITPQAIEIIALLDSYSEVSPSGKGVHIFVMGKLREGGKRRKGGLELYDRGRYFTISGDHLTATPREIHERQAQLDQLQKEVFQDYSPGEPVLPQDETRIVLADEELLSRARRNEKFRRLFDDGDVSLYGGDESAADMALCNQLSFWAGRDAALMDYLFRQSKLFRPKWLERRGESTYGEMTINKAIRDCSAIYNPQYRATPPDTTPEPVSDADDGTGDWSPYKENRPIRPRGDKPSVHDLEEMIKHQHTLISDGNNYVYEYNGQCWKPITKHTIKALAMKYDADGSSDSKRRNEAAEGVITACLTPTIPWRSLGEHEIPVKNGVVDIRDEQAPARPHRAQDYLETVVPHDFDRDAKCPRWMQALQEWFEKDEDCHVKILALQEFFGYVLMPHSKYKKALFLLGGSDTGKSQVLGCLTDLVGTENTCSIGVGDMDDQRKVAPIKGKMLNQISELSANSVIADGGFKRLVSTGDPIQIDPKHLAPESYIPSCKHVIMTNTLPRCDDHTDATYGRILLISFNHKIPRDKQDASVLDKFKREMPGILLWSIAGARRLWAQHGQFTAIPESARMVDEYRKDNNDMNEFLEDRCLRDPDAKQELEPFRNAYRLWSGNKSISNTSIGHRIRKAGGVLSVISVGGKSKRGLIGYKLNEVGLYGS